jgi:hypothetical protein
MTNFTASKPTSMAPHAINLFDIFGLDFLTPLEAPSEWSLETLDGSFSST